jgi:type I restriction enzyme, S subunit
MNWPPITVADLVESDEAEVKTGPFGTQLHASDYVKTGTPVINVRNIGFGEIRKNKLEFIADETVERLSTHVLHCNDIVFGRKGAVERHVFIQTGQDKWFQGSDCIRLRLKSEKRILARYLSYLFLTKEHQSWMMQQCSHGATMPSLNQDIIKRITLNLPPLPTQRRIVSILSAYDDLIKNNTRRIAILEEMARRVYEEWFVHFRFPGHEGSSFIDTDLGRMPGEWESKSLGTLVEIKKGQNITKKTIISGEVPVVAGGLKPAYYHNKANTAEPVVTISASGANAGFVRLYQEDVWASDCSYIDANATSNVLFFYQLLKCRQNDVTRMQKGTAQPHVYPADLMGLPVCEPSPDIVERFLQVVSPKFALNKNLNRNNANLRAQRDLLLPKLISGEINVSDDAELTDGVAVA